MAASLTRVAFVSPTDRGSEACFVFSWGPAPRRNVRWLAAAALLTLAAATGAGQTAIPAAVALGPGGGYQDTNDDRGKRPGHGLDSVWSAARAPLRWLRQSGRSFQSLMRLLAERSALRAGDGTPPPLRPKRPPKDPVEAADDPPQRSSYGGEAGAGSNHGVRVKEWRAPKDWDTHPASCRRAGVPVRRGGWYVVQRGDTLWRIAEVHYGYGEAYLRLRRANGGSLPDANLLYPCQRLYIPRWRCCGLSERGPPEHDDAKGGDAG
jgi:nucleoid-associated protein YgaU